MSETERLSLLNFRASAQEIARQLRPPRSLRLFSTASEESDSTPFDGVLEIEVRLFLAPVPQRDCDTNASPHDSLVQEIVGLVDALNHTWYVTGRIAGKSAKAADQVFKCCPIQFVPRILLDTPDSDDDGTFYTIQLSRTNFPATRWHTAFEVPELILGSAFEDRIPPGARERITVCHLKSRIDRFHSLPPFDVAARLAGVREIVTGAGAFLEVEAEIDETWAVDAFVSAGDCLPAQAVIEGAVRHYREANQDDYGDRMVRLGQVLALLKAFREPTQLRLNWRATKHTLEIDGALIAYDDLPTEAYRERIDALGRLRGACMNYIAHAQVRSRFFHRGQHDLIPAVEVLEQRAHTKQVEIAVSCGIAAMAPRVDAKLAELGMLDAMRYLKLRALSVQSGLVAQRRSQTLLIDYDADETAPSALGDALAACFPMMMGVDKSIHDLRGEDLLPLVRLLIPEDTEVHRFT